MIRLPLRTVSEANRRDHWATKARRVNEHRGTALLMLRARARKVGLPCTVILIRVAPRELDDDNLRSALKAVRDGAADALGVDDRDPRVTWAYGQRRGKTREYAVEVRVE